MEKPHWKEIKKDEGDCEKHSKRRKLHEVARHGDEAKR